MINPKNERRNRLSPIHTDILNSPVLQLQRSLAAQQALLKQTTAIPDLSKTLTPPSVRVFQDIQTMMAVQHSIRSELADTALALRTAQNRVLVEVQAMASARDAVTKQFRQVTEATAAISQVFSGNVLSNIRSMLAVREAFASEVRDSFQAITKVKDQISNDVLSSIRAATVARTAIVKRHQDAIRAASSIRSQEVKNLQAVMNRLSTLRLDELGQMAEELEAKDSLFAAWSEEGSEALAVQLEADIAANPQADEWSVEEQVNYLIEWTQKQNSQFQKIMMPLIISLIANFIFWLSTDVVPGRLGQLSENPPSIKIVIQDVRERITEQPIPSDDLSRLRIVARRSAPVKAARRRRSARVATLYAGELVQVCEKRGKWVFVEWTDVESGMSYDGWILSKYLSRVRKGRRW